MRTSVWMTASTIGKKIGHSIKPPSKRIRNVSGEMLQSANSFIETIKATREYSTCAVHASEPFIDEENLQESSL